MAMISGFESGSTSELLLPRNYRKSLDAGANFATSRPPSLGPGYGSWAGRSEDEIRLLEMPGGALMQFDLGRLGLSDFRGMRDHYQVHIADQALTVMQFSVDWHIEHPDQSIADELTEQLRRVWVQLIRGTSQARWAGFSPMVLEWENNDRTGRVEISRIKDLYPEECTVNWRTVAGFKGNNVPGQRPRRFLYNGINQGAWSNFPQHVDGGGRQSRYSAQGPKHTIPPEATFWYTMHMPNGNYYGRKLLRPAFPPVFFSNLIHLYQNRYFERFGEPLPVGRAPFDEDVEFDGKLMKGNIAMERIMDNFRSRAAVVLPSSKTMDAEGRAGDWEYSIDYIESQMRGADFERYLTRLDEEISLAYFMPVLLIRVAEVGSYNLGEAHLRLFQTSRNYETEDLGNQIERFILRRYIDYNFGCDVEDAKFVFRKMGKDRDETTRSLLQSAIQQQFVRPDAEDLSQLTGVRLHEIVQVLDDSTAPIDAEPDDRPQPMNPDDPNAVVAMSNSMSRYRAGKGIPGKNDFWRSLMRDGTPSDTARRITTHVYGASNHIVSTLEAEGYGEERIRDGLGKIMNDFYESAIAD